MAAHPQVFDMAEKEKVDMACFDSSDMLFLGKGYVPLLGYCRFDNGEKLDNAEFFLKI